MEFDYCALRKKIREEYRTEQNFAIAMGIGRVSLSKKLNNDTDFTCTQMLRAAKLLGIELKDISSYFFVTKVQKQEPA